MADKIVCKKQDGSQGQNKIPAILLKMYKCFAKNRILTNMF